MLSLGSRQGEEIMPFQYRICGVAAVLIAVACLGTVETQAQSLSMERVTGEDGRYSIEMPKGYTTTTSPRPDGGTLRQLSYLWKDSVGQYNAVALAIIDPPPGSTKNFDMWEVQRQLTARYPGSFLGQSQEIQSGPAKGMSFVMTVNSTRGQGVHVIAVRIYGLGSRLYEMLAETRAEDQDDATVTAFMNSLRVIR
jgi:hypothetical protein